ncbi:unnamed protein product [marine sediment metagenome]|uniref:Uncharacterized protein n=1 Tax=marine sediment metagenome TaxID=412755 RepID=X0Y3W7_9ZZZZ
MPKLWKRFRHFRLPVLLRRIRQGHRLRRYRRALRVLDSLGQEGLQVLLERVRKGLPLPPEAALRQYEEGRNALPEATMALAFQYDEMTQHPAWLHFTGGLLSLQQEFEMAILQGRQDPLGHDLTKDYRLGYGLLQAIMAIPEDVKARREWFEREEMGIEA